MPDLDLSRLPDLPQQHFLRRVLAGLWQDPAVVCIWLTGSLARGVGDIYSDVDLGIPVQADAFDADRLPASAQLLLEQAVVYQAAHMGEHATLHHLLLALVL